MVRSGHTPSRTPLVRAGIPPCSPQWFGRGDPSGGASPALGTAQPVSPKPRARAPQSVQPAIPRVASGCHPAPSAHERYGPSAPCPASLRRCGSFRGSRPSPTAPRRACGPLPFLASQPSRPAAAADPGPLGPSHGEPPALFLESSTAPPPRPLPRAHAFVHCPRGSGVFSVVPPWIPRWYAPGSPLCCAFGSRWGWGGLRGRGGLKLLLTPRPDLNAGWGAGGRSPGFLIGKLVSPAGNLEMGEGAGERRRRWVARVLHTRA